MTPADLKAARRRLGFRSRRTLAEALGVSTRAIDSWEQGWRPIPNWLPNFLECLSRRLAQGEEITFPMVVE